MSDGRLRYVLSDPRKEKVCLEDVITAFVSCSDKMSKLEYKNSAHALRESKRVYKEARKVLVEFHERLYNEITEEVIEAKSKIDKRVDPKDPDTRKKYFGD